MRAHGLRRLTSERCGHLAQPDEHPVAVNGHGNRVFIGMANSPRLPDQPWPLPRKAADVPLVRRAATLCARLPDYG
jgi:hypothetical protein